MSKTVFRFLASELKAVRLACRSCRAVLELPLDRLDGLGRDLDCPVCERPFSHEDSSFLPLLAAAVRGMERTGLLAGFVVEPDGRAVQPASPPAL
jgi:hypothetical protein